MASVSADKLRHEIQIILKDADFNTLSSKKVRQMLEGIFQCDFTERKKEIDDILMSEITTRDTTPILTSNSCQIIDNQSQKPLDQQTTIETPQQEICSTTSNPRKRQTTPSLKIERRKTCYNKELDISDQLACIVDGHRMPRSEVVKRMWVYIKEHKLLDPVNKQYINCDETLSKIFGRRRVRAFGMLKDLARHMSDPDKQ
ncbi:unnamed protein product [Adineta ricciae]|uniref:DM2 domain-containing protein n=1 Tax=Adineta ricciae TaxID=249248 RepID=A0A816G7F1_ADIRI|nr:unnamed protein product [Adineta ricciae]